MTHSELRGTGDIAAPLRVEPTRYLYLPSRRISTPLVFPPSAGSGHFAPGAEAAGSAHGNFRIPNQPIYETVRGSAPLPGALIFAMGEFERQARWLRALFRGILIILRIPMILKRSRPPIFP